MSTARRRRPPTVSAAITVLLAATCAAGSAHATERPPYPVSLEYHQVTLLTGDTVRYAATGDGHFTVTMDPAPGRTPSTYRIQ